MLIHPGFDPVALRVGPLAVHWYGLMYLVGFALFWWLGQRRLRHKPYHTLGWQGRDVEDMLFWGVLGVIVGGRLGYVLFYQPLTYLAQPWRVFAVWEGGMSFHGGLLGVLAAMALWARRQRRSWLQVMDFVAPCVPAGLAAGRIGNFINGELWGRVASADLPWAMVFPAAGPEPRHPSQLYQAGLEGLTLFLLLWWWAPRARYTGEVSAAFLVGYGSLRFAAEYFREPDAHLGLLSLGLSMGQWLSLPLIVCGVVLWAWVRWRAPQLR
ncbi:prolipoprotein diacylglyceryl transferase [Tepidimonas sp.]|uniref:prolipoprotein diacylglyceryl transferase n=1 Tax=Tepidimonas sp. TaxID=2002775 RepID=UPI002FE3E241